jgi:hypothetical protein
LRPHATQGTRLPIKFNALFTIKNKKERFVNAENAYLRVRGVGGGKGFVKLFFQSSWIQKINLHIRVECIGAQHQVITMRFLG